jgi:hypothetical protein
MFQEQAANSGQTQPKQVATRDENPLPDVPFMGIAAFLGFLVLVLIAAAAYSLAESLPAFTVTPSLWAPAVFMLLVFGLFYLVDRYQPRTHTR